jgi:hypothetical protein
MSCRAHPNSHRSVAFLFLENLMSQPSLIQELIDLLDSERRYEFEERAGIIEFDAEQPRDQAELLALVDLLRSHPAALVPLTVLEVEDGDASQLYLTTDVDAARDYFAAKRCTVRSIVQLRDAVSERFQGIARLSPLQ